jgi:NADH dehydrogenase
VYALGDFANTKGQDGKPLPQLAAVAEQSGKHCAENIATAIEGRPGKAFHYKKITALAVIAGNSKEELWQQQHSQKMDRWT